MRADARLASPPLILSFTSARCFSSSRFRGSVGGRRAPFLFPAAVGIFAVGRGAADDAVVAAAALDSTPSFSLSPRASSSPTPPPPPAAVAATGAAASDVSWGV